MTEMKLERSTIPSQAEDAFADFREIALLDVKHEFDYRLSFGKTSKFFLALQEDKLLATRCRHCASVYMPPRAICPKDLEVTEWLELSGEGTLKSWTLCPYPPSYAVTEKPYLLAYVNLEGTDSLFLHQLKNAGGAELSSGLKVKTVFGALAKKHPLELFWFELA